MMSSNGGRDNEHLKRDRESTDGRVRSSHTAACSLLMLPLESSSEDDLGPALPSTAPPKKKRKLPYEKLYISALPAGGRYSKSLMHREQVACVTVTPSTDFIITSSVDGVVKFWKKTTVGVEFVKEFKAHSGEIRAVSVSQDGRSFASAGSDNTIKIFDVVTFGETQSVPRYFSSLVI